jgi:hypothetical protein
VNVLDARWPQRVVVFAAGRGGDPARHLPLLEALHADGATVIAPRAEMFTNPRPTRAQLLERALILREAVDSFAPSTLPLHGVGHSIGATMLFAMAGAQAWLGPEAPLSVPTRAFESLTLLAPALGFFQAPHAADAVRAGTTIVWGDRDAFCPRSEVDHTLAQLGARGRLRVCEGAGHFSFMHVPPPNTSEPLVDRDRFLAELTASIVDDVRGARATAR